MMSQLIIENGGLFDSWEPYAELTTFTYHYGFHSLVAVFHWISGVPVEKAILWTGQLTNIFAIIALYPLAYKIGKNRWAGVIAVLIAGLLSPMPMSYVNWGRYTQLAGQVILPAVIWIAWSLLERPFLEWGNIPWIRRLVDWRNLSFDIGSLVVVWFVLGGIALTHYRILILAILFFPAYFLLTVSRRTIIGLLGRIAWIGFGGFVLAAPWFIQAFGGKLIQIFTFQITTIPSKTAVNSEFFIVIRNFLHYMPIFIWVLFLLCVVWGLWKRKKDIAVFTSWWFIIIIATNPNWIGLPGTDVITNFAIYISSYIPVSVIIGSVVACILINDLPSKKAEIQNLKIIFSKLPVTVLLFGIVCFFGIWGLINRIRDINIPNFELVTRPDLRAMEWIRDNTPIDARFLINSFSAYEDSSIVGSDAGWWLPLLAQRQSTVPPLTYVAEQAKTPDYAQKIKEFYEKINENGINDPEVLNMLKEEGINYVYVGQRHGSVNNPGPPLLDLEILNSDQHFQLIYHQDRVWVYKIN
jgi:hypothetical protein